MAFIYYIILKYSRFPMHFEGMIQQDGSIHVVNNKFAKKKNLLRLGKSTRKISWIVKIFLKNVHISVALRFINNTLFLSFISSHSNQLNYLHIMYLHLMYGRQVKKHYDWCTLEGE